MWKCIKLYVASTVRMQYALSELMEYEGSLLAQGSIKKYMVMIFLHSTCVNPVNQNLYWLAWLIENIDPVVVFSFQLKGTGPHTETAVSSFAYK